MQFLADIGGNDFEQGHLRSAGGKENQEEEEDGEELSSYDFGEDRRHGDEQKFRTCGRVDAKTENGREDSQARDDGYDGVEGNDEKCRAWQAL